MGRENRDEPPALPEIRRLIANTKALRREAESLRVRCWRAEDRIAELEAILREAEAARQVSADRLRDVEAQIARLRCFAGGSPLECGFRLGDGAMVIEGAVRRTKTAPSGTMIFGPYMRLPPGRYAATVTARLYQPAAPFASFTVDAVCGSGEHVMAVKGFRVWPLFPARSCRLAFSVPAGLDRDDFEVRVWARRGTPLEISRIALRPIGAAAVLPTPDGTVVPAAVTA